MTAAIVAALIVLLLGRLLMLVPALPTHEARAEMRVRWVPRSPPPVRRPVPAVAPAEREPTSSPATTTKSATPPRQRPPATVRPPVTGPAAAANAMGARLYDRQGRLQLPPSAQVDPMAPPPPGLANAKPGAFERENPIDVQTTRFDKDWKTDGSLGAVAAQKMERGMQAVSKAIFGEDPQEVRARPPPDVGFKPDAYEQASDLGSEATGDAYKAAPIVHEKAPGLKGEASRRILARLQSLQQRASACGDARRQQLLAPVRRYLQDLQQAEHAFKQGADPVMAEQLLPRRADNAYDQARRALWYADQQWTRCQP
ncbi:hypothetical protein ABB29_02775 [Pseudoxanthomonas dokdonensis]|uniref:Uncharacterized protein n=2 Tax=Pseudoxanthomonas dokdonensis TaxID=344882 RepID=A0A0R0CQA8_9GAMM|nr:hypothetical protein ABB29_02775 [Pseudoxanthomonas dokdonensis]